MECLTLFLTVSFVCLWMQSHSVEAAPKLSRTEILSWKMQYNLCEDDLEDMSQRVCDDKLEEPIVGGRFITIVSKCCTDSCTLEFLKNVICPHVEIDKYIELDALLERFTNQDSSLPIKITITTDKLYVSEGTDADSVIPTD